MATAISRSLTPDSASSSSSPVTMRSTSSTCCGAVPAATQSDPESQKLVRSDQME